MLERISTGIAKVDAVCSMPPPGGLVRGGTYLISGWPGIGKSTLLLKIVSNIGASGSRAVYASGEQNDDDVRHLARRTGCALDGVVVVGMDGDVRKICNRVKEEKASLVVVDSLQTAFLEDVDSHEGSGAQCKAVAKYLTAFGKRERVAVIIVCQLNKDGDLAGLSKSVIEHEVDCVLDFDFAAEYDKNDVLIPETESLRRLTARGRHRYNLSDVSCTFTMTRDGLVLL